MQVCGLRTGVRLGNAGLDMNIRDSFHLMAKKDELKQENWL
jgi:hypothetical protein